MLFVLTHLIMRACANLCQEAWQVLARLSDICQNVLRGLARLTNIRQDVLQGRARLAKICQAVLRGLAGLADICQKPFLRKCDSPRQIGASNLRVWQIWRAWPLLELHYLI
jgi:hypothetical protein